MELKDVYVIPNLKRKNDACRRCGKYGVFDGEPRCRYQPTCPKWRMLQRMQIPHLFKRGGRINAAVLEELK